VVFRSIAHGNGTLDNSRHFSCCRGFGNAAEEGVTLCAIAQAIGAGLGVPVRSLAKDEARTHFDWLAGFVAMDNPTSSALTREALGWSPKESGLLADMKESGYFY
jgi:hypothetical protein